MYGIDWLLFAGWVGLVVAAWNVNVAPKGKTAMFLVNGWESVDKAVKRPVRHEKKADKRGKMGGE